MTMTGQEKMEKIVSLAKRRGFIYQGSELYGGLAGTWDYGPIGVLLKNNIKQLWWDRFVTRRSDIYGLDAAILMNEKVWQASGHVEGFADPLVEDVETHERFRLDHLLEEVGVDVAGMSLTDMESAMDEHELQSPAGNKLTKPRAFNMMFETKVGASDDSASTSYLRPETAQGIFANFKNVLDTFHPKLPFGIAQIGKAFRNEIAPRDFLFRSREFEQMEIEWFTKEADWEDDFDNWRNDMWSWMEEIGLSKDKVYELDVPEADLAHYSKKTIDFEYEYPFGRKELYGLAYRTDHDLKKHQEHSTNDLSYFDQEAGERFVPHVIEPSLGVDRTVMALLCDVYDEEDVDGDTRVVMRFAPKVAPVTVAVLPLMRKEDLIKGAKDIFNTLVDAGIRAQYDETGSIGKRYRRQDEIGTPFAVTIDFDSLEDNAVTVRHRDSMEQERVAIADLEEYIKMKL